MQGKAFASQLRQTQQIILSVDSDNQQKVELDVKSHLCLFFFLPSCLNQKHGRSLYICLKFLLKLVNIFLFYRKVRRNFSQIGNTVNLLPLICLKILLQFMNFFELLLFMPRSIKLFFFIIINDIYPGSSTHSKVVFREVLHPFELE